MKSSRPARSTVVLVAIALGMLGDRTARDAVDRRRYGGAVAPRIAPLRRADAAPAVEAMYRRMDALGNPPPNMHLTFGKNPALYESWLPFATYVIPASSLPHRDRQILILRTALTWRSGYVWSQHVEISKFFEVLSDHEIAALGTAGPPAPEAWSSLECALITASDETRTEGEISEPVWEVLAGAYDEAQLLDVVFTIGQYALISTGLRSLGVELDDGLTLPDWAAS
jgi:alkylhydroperoxidase family enzyme